jgi:hypothetical protein
MRHLTLPIRGCHPLRPGFPSGSGHVSMLGWSAFARHYLRSLMLMSFPPGTEMFQFPGFASCDLCIQSQDTRRTSLLIAPSRERTATTCTGGLPHSEILGSKPIPGSPRLIAGYRVLPRLLLPRHPPNALLALDPTRGRTGPRTAHPGSRDSSPTPRSEVVHSSQPATPRPPAGRRERPGKGLGPTHPREPKTSVSCT